MQTSNNNSDKMMTEMNRKTLPPLETKPQLKEETEVLERNNDVALPPSSQLPTGYVALSVGNNSNDSNIKTGSTTGKVKIYTELAKESSKLSLKQKILVVLESICEHPSFVVMMGIFTIWSLFEDDIRLAACRKNADNAFEAIISVAFFCFIFEIIASCFYKKDYFVVPKWEEYIATIPDESFQQACIRRLSIGGFYFWLDVGATLTLITELYWMLQTQGGPQVQGDNDINAGAGARAGRIVRLVRMIRLVRMVKLYKYGNAITEKRKEQRKRKESFADHEFNAQMLASTTLTSIKESEEDEDEEDDDDDEENSRKVKGQNRMQQESQVGSKMSDTTNKRVIVLILSLIIVVPFLSVEDPDTSKLLSSLLMENLYAKNPTNPTYSPMYAETVAQLNSYNMNDILQVTTNGVTVYSDQAAIDALRPAETVLFKIADTDLIPTTVLFSDYDNSKSSAENSIYTTLFIIGVLSVAIYFFTNDVHAIIVRPLEQMVKIIISITENPMGVKFKMLGEEQGFKKGMETTILLSTILKIVGMMRVSFGEAGGPIIAESLMNFSGKLDVIGLGGKLISSIFGFCDVRQFTDTTECLQEEVMIFVNRIAHILHSITVQCNGLPNKNIGDAFLLTWKLPKTATDKETSFLADQALLCFCKALIELSRYEEFIIDFTIAATSRLYKRFPNYHVRIGSGLHMGWAIEGAIGTNNKIDASYLSPHVNTTEFLESSTKAYGVALLISEPFFKLLSPAAQKYVRQVDCVKKSINADPFGIYTYDSDLSIEWPSDYDNGMSKNIYKKKINVSQKLFAQKAAQKWMKKTESVGKSKVVISNDNGKKTKNQSEDLKHDRAPKVVIPHYEESVWDDDYDLILLRRNVSESFRLVWQTGIEAYLKGDWQKALEIFTNTLKLSGGKDGPSKFLLEYMKEHDNKAPSDWQGWRDESGGGH